MDYADQRFYSSINARFLTPDPYIGSVAPSDPQSWNRYTYGLGDPTNHADPTGLCTIAGVIYPDGQSPCPNGTSVTVSTSVLSPADVAWLMGYFGTAPPKPKPNLEAGVQAGASDCEALGAFTDLASVDAGNAYQFVRSFGILTPVTVAGLVASIVSSANRVYLNTGQASGYAANFQNISPDNARTGWNGDQGHHFAAFLQLGYQMGAAAGGIASDIFERFQALFRGETVNRGDIALGIVAAQIGGGLKAGEISYE